MIDDAHSKRRLKVINSTSPSQVSAFAEVCNRYWFYQSVEGLRDKEDEKPAHLMRGSHIDRLVEHALTTGVVLDETIITKHPQDDGTVKTRPENWTALIKEVLKHLPDPKQKRLTLQHWAETATYDGGPVCVVKPDVMHCPTKTTLRVDDLKTTSDFKYCKSAVELAQNVQLNTYARYGYEELKADEVRIGHAYARTKWDYKAQRPAAARAHRDLKPHGADKGLRGDEPCECPECKAWLSKANRGQPLPDGAIMLSRAHVDAFWQSRVVPQVRLMVEAASNVREAAELPPSTEKCSKIYGQPCPYRARCGFDENTNTIFGGGNMETTKGNGVTMTLSERLAAARAAQTQAVKEVERIVNEGAPNGGQMVSIPGRDGGVTVGGGGPPAVDGYKPGQGCNGRGYYASANGQGFVPVEAGHVHGPNCPGVIHLPHIKADIVIGEQPASAPGYTAPAEGAGMNVLPPEVRHLRESTPEQVVAAEAGKKRGRPKKATTQEAAPIKVNAECQFCGGMFPVEKLDAHRETLHPAEMKKFHEECEVAAEAGLKAIDAARKAAQDAVVQPDLGVGMVVDGPLNAADIPRAMTELGADIASSPAVARIVKDVTAATHIKSSTSSTTTTDTAQSPDAVRAEAQAKLDATLASARPTGRKMPPTPPVLYVDCRPRKGEPAVEGDVWLGPIAELAAIANVDRDGKSAPVEDFRLIPYTADGVLAVAVRACLDSCPARLALSSESRAHRVALEVLTPFAREIVGR